MTCQKITSSFKSMAGILACVVLSAATLSPAWAKDKLPEVSSDGLHLLKNSKVRIAYVKPGVTLEKYSKVKMLDCFVQFKKHWQQDYNMNEVGLSGRVTNMDAENIKKKLAAEFATVFTKVLTEAGHEVVDTAGPDVLLLRPAIINLDVTAPDIPPPDMREEFVDSAGQMTLYMEMYDSVSSTLLARVIDPEAGDRGMALVANRVTNRAEADAILRGWAELLAKHLGNVKQGGTTP